MARSKQRRRNREHAAQRAGERYGIHLTQEDIRNLSGYIARGMGTLIERESRTASKFFITTDCGVELPVVYSKRRATIITVLPPDAEEVKRALAKRSVNA